MTAKQGSNAMQLNAASAMESSYLNGVIARSCQQVVAATTLPEISQLIVEMFSELGISGLLRLQIKEEKLSQSFGESLRKSNLKKLLESNQQQQKVYQSCNITVIQDDSVIFLIEDASVRYNHHLIDVMTSYIDIIQSWCNNYSHLRNIEQELFGERQKLINHIKQMQSKFDLVESQIDEIQEEVVEEILGNLMQAFPTLGLEADQENLILDIFHTSFNKQIKIFKNQMDLRLLIKNLLDNAILTLNKSNHPSSRSVTALSKGIELF